MFNWNNYVGKHMKESLKVECGDKTVCELYSVSNNTIELISDCGRFDTPTYNTKPLIKSISDLTDEELLFVFCGINTKGRYIERTTNQINMYMVSTLGNHLGNCVFLKNVRFTTCDQLLLNRLYSLHVSLDYEELIKNNKAVRKDV